MAAEMTVDCRKTFPGRLRLLHSFRIPLGLDRVDPVRSVRVRQNDGSALSCRTGVAGRRDDSVCLETWLDTASNKVLSPQDRHIGYMPQDYALFPNYSVAGNIDYGLGDLPPEAADRSVCGRWWSCSNFRGLKQAKPANCPVGNSNAWRLLARSPPGRSCCCWMNPCRRWTRRHARSCVENSEGC